MAQGRRARFLPPAVRILQLLLPALCAAITPLAACAAETESVELKPRLYTSGSSVRKAFGEAVEVVRKSTVEVRIDGKPRALGTIVSDDGWVVTKASESNGEVTCRLSDGRDLPAKVVGANEANDLALLKLDASGLTAVEWEMSGDPSIGQWVATAGVQSLPAAVGVVSTARRQIPYKRISGVLGIRIEEPAGPARIGEVYEDSAAESVGLKAGDFIERVQGKFAGTGADFIDYVRQKEPGDEVELVIRRGEERLTVTATLMHPDGLASMAMNRVAEQNLMGGRLSPRRTGFDAVIQHDSVLRPHECGGPVVTLTGKAFGINVARAGRTETYALPADILLPLIEEMKSQATSMTSAEK
jgi:serine protease Do